VLRNNHNEKGEISVYNLDEITRIYFSCVPIYEIIKGLIPYDNFPEKDFFRLSKAYMTYYSDTENGKLYEFIKESAKTEGHPYAGAANRSGLNVFAALETLSGQILIVEESKVLCRYSEILRFREISKYVEEDLLICAYLVFRKGKYGEREQHTHFGWDTVIGHNNAQLKGILREGISENHFHLYGSAPIFQLIWIYYMNNLMSIDGITYLRRIGENPRYSRNHYYTDYKEEGYERTVLKAALIRIVLFSYLNNKKIHDRILELFDNKISAILENEVRIEDYLMEIQMAVNMVKAYFIMKSQKAVIDYALFGVGNGMKEEKSGNISFSGERWFVYQMLEHERTGKIYNKKYMQWFYAYLIIKQNMRNEVLQTNDTVGFENFSIYTNRKHLYQDNGKLAQTAVYSSLLSENLKSLEIRITPEKTAADNARRIKYINKLIGLSEDHEKQRIKTKIYYVFHFVKCQDDTIEEIRNRRDQKEHLSVFEEQEIKYYGNQHCRHYKKRRALNRQANEIREFREKYPREAKHVLGIDACSQEIGCRPEVFAPMFRFLSEHITSDLPEAEVSQLKMTYHVGEDFLDVVDGLRAVDEAIHFFTLQCGDRIGHGTVLGIDIYKWYKYKRNTIILPQQDYLDNVVWLYHKLTEFKITNCEGLQHYLEEQFDIFFSKIYGESILENIDRYSIHAYYEAWKLRGDDPELYKRGYFSREVWHYNRDYLINYLYPEMFDSRKRREVGLLYYAYHYNCRVKEEGSKAIEVYIPSIFLDGVCEVQKAMRNYIAACGIGIETNPSSNLLISTMQRYDEHPIVQLYNKDLVNDIEKLKECPQANVSINTDDKGVFRTSLENEYALMACALEKVRDEKGNMVYNRQMIFQWIDNIRKMGNLQSFYKG